MRLVRANPVVPEEIERKRMAVVFDLLRKPIRQPREAAHLHPHGQIVPLGKGRVDVLGVGIAPNGLSLDADQARRAIPALLSS